MSLILVGRRVEDSNQREKDRITLDIQRLVREEYKRQAQAEYVNSDRVVPLNRYEVAKLVEQEPEELPETKKPRSDFENIYGGSSERYSGGVDGLPDGAYEELIDFHKNKMFFRALLEK